jgi:hypothetical protein
MSDKYIGDFKKGQQIRVKFNTFSQALIPTAPSVDLEVAIYKDSATEITTNGITQPTPNFDSKNGLHELVVDTSDVVYEVGKDYDIVFTAGTVDGKDLTRTILRTFSLENRNTDANVIMIAGQTASAAAPVSFPPSVANETTVNNRPTLAQIEGSTVLAKDSTVAKDATVAKEATLTQIADRIGAFAGSGVNTVIGFLRAIMRKDAGIATPTDVGGTYNHTTDSIEAIRDRGDAAWTTGADGGGGPGGDPWSTDLAIGGYTGTQAGAVLQSVAAKTNTITAGKVSYAGPVTAKGTVDQIVIGDDYLTAHGTAFVWTISAIPGMSAGAVTVHFGGKNGTNPFAVTGTAADIGSGKWSLTCEMPKATSGGLVPGEYRYSVAVHNAAGVELTRVYYEDPFVAVEKFTP